jgi:uncharacterized RDD family membrane protein YckC
VTISTEKPLEPTSNNLSIYPRAPWGKRTLAFIIDSLIGGLTLPVLSILLLLMVPWFMGYQPLPFLEGVPRVFFFITLGGFVISCIWFCLYCLLRDGVYQGQSLGKLICGLMVVHVEKDQPCNLIGSLLRNAPGFVSVLISFALIYCAFIFLLIEPVAVFSNEKGLRLGDRWAKTQVIEKKHYRQI